jgi:hypothetical protein
LTVLERLVPREPLSWMLLAPRLVPMVSHHSRTGAPLAVHWKVTLAPGRVEPGVGLVMVGVLVVPVRASKAAFTSMRGLITLLRLSVIGTPVLWRAERISLTDADGFACLRIAKAPATCGAAIEVPVLLATFPLPGTADVIFVPGASKDKKDALFELSLTVSLFVVLPTLIADEIQAGAASASVKPLLPEATTLAIPTERKLSIGAFSGSVSQLLVNLPPPRLMFTAAILNVLRNSNTRSSPLMISE